MPQAPSTQLMSDVLHSQAPRGTVYIGEPVSQLIRPSGLAFSVNFKSSSLNSL